MHAPYKTTICFIYVCTSVIERQMYKLLLFEVRARKQEASRDPRALRPRAPQ